MATRQELRELLGCSKNLNARSVQNRAIRAFCVGGDDCLDALEKVNRLAERLRERSIAGADSARAALELLREVREQMADFVYNTSIERLKQHDRRN
jgi:hypothetical protein